jgi:hypothetical protein
MIDAAATDPGTVLGGWAVCGAPTEESAPVGAWVAAVGTGAMPADAPLARWIGSDGSELGGRHTASAAAISRAEGNRSAGDFARPLITTLANASGR